VDGKVVDTDNVYYNFLTEDAAKAWPGDAILAPTVLSAEAHLRVVLEGQQDEGRSVHSPGGC